MYTAIFDGNFLCSDLQKLYEGKTSLQILYEHAQKLPVNRFIAIHNGTLTDIPEGIKSIVPQDDSPAGIMEIMFKEARDTENIILFNSGSPFFDKEFIDEMIRRHEDYIADYTYALGYPAGLVPAIVKKDILAELIKLVENETELQNDYIFQAIYKDINSFDIETILSEHDVRLARTSVGNNDRGEIIFTNKLFKEKSCVSNFNTISEFIATKPENLYSTWYTLILELTNHTDTNCTYIPEHEEEKQEMDLEYIKRMLPAFLEENDSLHLILGGIGEPFLHDNWFDILTFFMSLDIPVIIETYGNALSESEMEKLTGFDKERLTFMVKIDSYSNDTYQKIHPAGNFEKVTGFITFLKNNGFKVFSEITRMIDNEVEIEKILTDKDKDVPVIRKFSTYCGKLEDKKVVDLSPIQRIPCFSIRRDIYITAGTAIAACRYSRFSKKTDIPANDVKKILASMEELYRDNASGNYTDYCKNCDDYYIFNF